MNMYNFSNAPEYNLSLWTMFLKRAIGIDSYWTHVTAISILLTIFIMSLIVNILTCAVIYMDKSMHTATNFYLFNMAVSDIIVSFSLLIEICVILDIAYLFGNISCKVNCFFKILLWNHSILIMTALAIERYVAIWKPWMLKCSSPLKRVMKIITIIWITAILEASPEVVSVEMIHLEKVRLCFTVPTLLSRMVNGVQALVTFVIPLAVIIYVYTMIALKVNVTEMSNIEGNIFNHRNNRGKIERLTVVMTLSFIICWLPFFIVRILLFSLDTEQLMQMERTVGAAIRVMLIHRWFSVVLNPILFNVMSTKFRKSLKMLWNKKIHRRDATPMAA